MILGCHGVLHPLQIIVKDLIDSPPLSLFPPLHDCRELLCIGEAQFELLVLLGPQAFQRGQMRIEFLIDPVLKLLAFLAHPAPRL